MSDKIRVEKTNGIVSVGKKIIADDAKSVGSRVLDSVVIPNIKRLISESVKNAIDWIIYGTKGSPNQGGYTNGIKTVSYNSLYSNSQSIPKQPAQQTLYNYNSIIYPNRASAEEVLFKCKEVISNYGMISVGDYYDRVNVMAGTQIVKSQYTDQKYGWRNLDSVTIIDSGDGYKLQFPKIENLE